MQTPSLRRKSSALVTKWLAPTLLPWRYWEGLVAGHGGDRNVAIMVTAAARLTRTYATQAEALRRLRNGGSQFVRLSIFISNGQAVIGNPRQKS
jgi:hypothetical protein